MLGAHGCNREAKIKKETGDEGTAELEAETKEVDGHQPEARIVIPWFGDTVINPAPDFRQVFCISGFRVGFRLDSSLEGINIGQACVGRRPEAFCW